MWYPMEIILIVLIAYFLLLILFLARNSYTYNRCENARILIYKYTIYLIEKRQYSSDIEYYDEMRMGYDKYLFSIWLWGKYSIIKPQYKELLKSFEQMENKKITDVIYNDF